MDKFTKIVHSGRLLVNCAVFVSFAESQGCAGIQDPSTGDIRVVPLWLLASTKLSTVSTGPITITDSC